MTEEMQMKYVRKVMAQWDRESQLATAIMTGEARGEAKGISNTAKAMKTEGIPIDVISKCTGLSIEEIATL